MQILSKEKDPNWLTNMLDNLRSDPEYRGYKLVITGHSLGAGVASVLAVLLKPKYEDLVCYAFSPPGCVLRFVSVIHVCVEVCIQQFALTLQNASD